MRGTICLTVLVSTFASGSASAEASESQRADLAASLERQHAQPLPQVQVVTAPLRWQPAYPLLAAFQRTVSLPKDIIGPATAPLDLQEFERFRVADDALAGLGGSINLRPSWPMLKYRDADNDLSLTLAPGSPCTGACLKITGSF
jgi:hypothetical protein